MTIAVQELELRVQSLEESVLSLEVNVQSLKDTIVSQEQELCILKSELSEQRALLQDVFERCEANFRQQADFIASMRVMSLAVFGTNAGVDGG